MDAVVSQIPSTNNMSVSTENSVENKSVSVLSAVDINELAFELGLWFSGLETFLSIRNQAFADENNNIKAASRDWSKEFRLTHSTLLLCSKLNFRLGKALNEKKLRQSEELAEDSIEDLLSLTNELEISTDDIYELSLMLKDSILINESLLRAAPLRFGEWVAWTNLLSDKLKSAKTFEKLIQFAEKTGEDYLPEILQKLIETRPFAEQSDLRLILPRFARILKWLSVVGKMLNQDEPLKPVLLIFSRVQEQIQETISYINNRLLRFPNEDDEFFGTLDGAAYTASIELKKVYNQELTGLVGLRPTPAIYAKIETAYSLLNDSFQQTLIGFAQMFDPNVESEKIFPNFDIKRRQSFVLRRDLWHILKFVQSAEHNPDKPTLEKLNEQLTDFLNNSLHYLFYKDKETVERFVEEILITNNKKDLVPILHRFGAYLETLFGQVNMRTVLANHPFER